MLIKSSGAGILLSLLIVIIVAVLAFADGTGGLKTDIITSIPRSMTYQGILKDADGAGIPDSFFDVTFRIFDTEAGGTQLWSQVINVGTEGTGMFIAELTNMTIPFDMDYWLELEIDSEILTPRQKLTMVGYSARSDTADYALATSGGGANGWVDDGASVRLETPSDLVGIGVTNPTAKLHLGSLAGVGGIKFEGYCEGDGISMDNVAGDGIHINYAMSDGIYIGGAENRSAYFGTDCYIGGNLGIGIEWPTDKLQVDGNASINGNTSIDGGLSATGNLFIGGLATIGPGNQNPGYSCFIVGQNNSSEDGQASITGGSNNYSEGLAAVISGGQNNQNFAYCGVIGGGRQNTNHSYYGGVASGYLNESGTVWSDTASFVGGGYSNSALGSYNFIGGGQNNSTNGPWSSIVGGSDNTVSQQYGTIAGGFENNVSGEMSFIGGGESNSIIGATDAFIGGGGGNSIPNFSGTGSMIGAGSSNKITGYYAVIGGGIDNNITGYGSVILGGESDTVTGNYSAIVGGIKNSITGHHSAIAGGENNSINFDHSFIGCGQLNTTGPYSAVASGLANSASGAASFIGSGQQNTAGSNSAIVCGAENSTGSLSFIGGGLNNTVNGEMSAIVNGEANQVNGHYSSILGGYADTISSGADYSYLFGINSNLTQDSTFMVDLPHIHFGDETTGYEFPTTDGTTGQVMRTDGAGQLSWITLSGTGGNGWVDDGAAVRLETPTDYVGIGTISPSSKLDVNGDIRSRSGLIVDNSASIGDQIDASGITVAEFRLMMGASPNYVLTSDASGNGTWQPLDAIGGAGSDNFIPRFDGYNSVTNSIIYDSGTNVGIGTQTPSSKLDVNGASRLRGNVIVDGHASIGGNVDASKIIVSQFQKMGGASSGYVLTSDASGNGTWQALPALAGSDKISELESKINDLMSIIESQNKKINSLETKLVELENK